MNLDIIQEIRSRVKRRYDPKILVLFRVGDYYEAYFHDAYVIKSVLGLTLDYRSPDSGRYRPTIRVPVSSQDEYLLRLHLARLSIHIYQAMDPQGHFKILL